jgi:phosphoesterase RecJ-like protein
MTQEASIAALLDLVRERQSFLITSHAGPDGDAIGTSLGLMHVLHAMGKQATVVLADPVPSTCTSLPGIETVVQTLPPGPADALIVLECDSFERTGFTRVQLEALNPGITINVDHHLSGKTYAGFNWIDPEAAAVGEMIYLFAIASGATITPAAATCLYAAVMTDSGSFTFALTSATTFALAAHLVELGADPSAIAQEVLYSVRPARARLLGLALSNFRIDGPVCWTSIAIADMQQAGAIVEDCEGIVNHLIGMEGIQAAVLVREIDGPQAFRLSLRSKGQVDVAGVARLCGGGGHRNASGCTLQGTLQHVLDSILPALQAACAEAAPLQTGAWL